MKDIAIRLPDHLALWLHVRAAEENRSVSAWLGDRIAEMKRREDEYHLAMERYLSMDPVQLKEPSVSYPDRESLHDREGLR